MSRKFAIAATLAFLAAALPTNAMGETKTVFENLSGKPTVTESAANPTEGNPFEDISLETPAALPPTPASPDGPPFMILIVKGSGAGDVACPLECGPETTVDSVLRKGIYPHPIDFKSAKIAIHRPRHHINDDLTVAAEEEIYRVEWDAKTGQPTAKTNKRLQPYDRLIVTLPRTSLPVQPPTPVPAGGYYTPYSPTVPVGAVPPVLAATPQPYVPGAPRAVVYSALTAAVPSPFGGESTVAVSPAIAPAPVLPAEPRQVQFNIVVVEDLDNSFAEFDELQSRMPCMLADTATMQGTLRILEKHKLVRRISEPKLITTSGKEATLEVGGESPNPQEPWQGIKTTVSARELGGGLVVEFGFKKTAGRRTNEVRTSLIVPHGQTVVMKTGGQPVEAASGDDATWQTVEHAVYVVLTPEIVK